MILSVPSLLGITGALLIMLICLGAILLTFAIVLGGPTSPKSLDSINAPFNKVDFSKLPALQHFFARDGISLSYRLYPSILPVSMQSVVLIHGSSASSASMHPLAQGMARAGFTVYTLDIRGHGASGSKGIITYIGQLEDDLEDFVAMINPKSPLTLVGFSSGGGFALRFAGSNRQKLFDQFLLLSPFIHQDAETYKANGGGWVSVGIPRVIALTILNHLGITCFNNLAVNAFALSEAGKKFLTPEYSFALATNFRPLSDYQANIRAAKQPMSLIAGQDDELFTVDRLKALFKKSGRPIEVTIVPGVDHVGLTLDDAAIKAITAKLLENPILTT